MPPKDWKFALEWRYGGTDERMLNTGVVREDAGTATQGAVALAVLDGAVDALTSVVSSDTSLMGVHIEGITTTDADLFVEPVGGPVAGLQTGGSGMPRNCCGLITFNTGIAGKRGRGRMYLPPTNNNDFEIGTSTWTAAFTALLTAAGNNFIDNCLAASPALIFGKYTLAGQNGFTSYDSDRSVGRRRLGTQRRRINGRGG